MFSLLFTCLHSCVNLVPKPETGEGKRYAFIFLVLIYLANNMDVLYCTDNCLVTGDMADVFMLYQEM